MAMAKGEMVRNITTSALLLALFTLLATGLVVVTHTVTAERVAQAERATLLQQLHTLIPSSRHDNELFNDRMEVRDSRLGTTEPVTVYRARKNGEPVAVILNTVAPDGYSGEIRLMVAVNYDSTLAGVRVISHRETPGLGDKIEAECSDWITRFTGRSLTDPMPAKWKVKKDGGAFDQFTGATITPRAVVKAVHNALLFVRDHRDELFAPTQEIKP